jgi:hypothetical protein
MEEKNKITIDDLATMIKNGFDDMDEKFKAVDEKFRAMDDKLSKKIDDVDNKLSKKIDNVAHGLGTLVDVLEDNRAINTKDVKKVKFAVEVGK